MTDEYQGKLSSSMEKFRDRTFLHIVRKHIDKIKLFYPSLSTESVEKLEEELDRLQQQDGTD